MPCERFAEVRLLHAYGEVESPEFEAHLRSCAECRAEERDIDEVREVYRSEPAPAPLRSQTPKRFPLAAWTAVAAAAIVAVTGWFLMQPAPRSKPVTPVGSDAAYMSGVSIDRQIASVRARLRSLRFSEKDF
jgi:hypothetical protein